MKKNQRKNPKKQRTQITTSNQVKGNFEIFSSQRYSHYLCLGILALFGVIYAFIHWQFLDIAMERDEGDYLLTGKLLLEGKTPYIDFYEQKPPGLFLSYALIYLMGAKSLIGTKIVFLVVRLFSTYLMYLVAKRLFDPMTGTISAITLLMLSTVKYASGFTIQAEFLIVPLILGAFLLLEKAHKLQSVKYYFFGGLVIGFGTLIKQNTVFYALVFGLFIWIYLLSPKNTSSLKKTIKNFGFYVAGGLSILLVFLLLLSFYGSLKEFWFWNYTYPRTSYVSAIEWKDGSRYLAYWYNNITENYKWVIWLSITGIVFFMFSTKSWYKRLIVVALLMAGFLTICPGYRFYGHYWQLFFPAIALALGTFFYATSTLIKRNLKINLNPIFFLIFLICFGFSLQKDKKYLFNPDLDDVINELYRGNLFNEVKVLSEYAKSQSNENDEILVLGSEPQAYIYSGLKTATSHIFIGHLLQGFEYSKERRDDLIQDLEQKPRFVLFMINGYSWQAKTKAGQDYFSDLYSRTMSSYVPIAYGDKMANGKIQYVYRKDARQYRPQASEYVMLLERQ